MNVILFTSFFSYASVIPAGRMQLVSSLGKGTCTCHCQDLSSSCGCTSTTCQRMGFCGSKGTRTSGGLNFYTCVGVSFSHTRTLRGRICGLAGGRLRLLVTSVKLVGVYRQATVGGRCCSCQGDTLHHVGHVHRRDSLFTSQRRALQLSCTFARFFVISSVCCCCLRRQRRTVSTLGRVPRSRTLASAGRLLCCRCVGNSTSLIRTGGPRREGLHRFSRLCCA